MTPLRIAHVITYFQPEFGYEEYLSARDQARLGHEVHVVTSDRIAPFKGFSLPNRLRGVGVECQKGIHIHRIPTLLEPYNDFGIVKGTSRVLQNIAPQVVHIHTLRQSMGYQAARLKESAGFTLVADNHEYFYPGHPMYSIGTSGKKFLARMEYLALRTPMSRYICRKSDALICVDEKTKNHITNYLKIKHPHLYQIPLSVDENHFRFRPKGRKRVREQFGISPQNVILVFSGILQRRKKLEEFISLLHALNNSNVILFLAGPITKPYLNSLQSQIENLGLTGRIFFPGAIPYEEMPDLFSAADIAVWMSSSSISILEAMACNLPIVHSRGQVFSKLVGENGALFQNGDIQDCARTLEPLIKKREYRTECGAKSRTLVEDKCGNQKRCAQLLEIYQRHLKSSRPTRG